MKSFTIETAKIAMNEITNFEIARIALNKVAPVEFASTALKMVKTLIKIASMSRLPASL